jgi:hypothetical protein
MHPRFIPSGVVQINTFCQIGTDMARPYTSGMDLLNRKRRDVLEKICNDRFQGNRSALARAIGRSPTIVWRLLEHGSELRRASEKNSRAR